MKLRNPDRSGDMRQEEGFGDSEGEKAGLKKASLAEILPANSFALAFWRPTSVPRLFSKYPQAVASSVLRLRQ